MVGKLKNKTAGIAIKNFFWLKPKIFSYLLDDNCEHKRAKCVYKNVVLTIRHSEYKDVLLNKKYLRHLMNGIKSEDHKDRFIKSTRFLCLALMIKYTSKTMDVMGLSLVIRVNYKKKQLPQ